MFIENTSVKIALKYSDKDLLKFMKENLNNIKSNNRKKLTEKALSICSREDMFYLLKYSFDYDDLCEMIIRMLCIEPLTNEMCKVLPMYLSKVKDLTIISNLPDPNITSLLSGLVSISDYKTALKIIIDNELDSKYLNSFINDVILQNEVFNSMHNCNSSSTLYFVLHDIVRFNFLRVFKYDVSTFCKDLEDRIILSGDIETIIKCSIYLDKDLFNNIFDFKSKLFEYMILNDYSSEEIKRVKKIIYTSNDKKELNNEIIEKVNNLRCECPVDNTRRFYKSREGNINMLIS